MSANTRVLYVSDSIGLGHAARDLAIARELRHQDPGIEIVWLAGDPARRLIADARGGGSRLRAASLRAPRRLRRCVRPGRRDHDAGTHGTARAFHLLPSRGSLRAEPHGSEASRTAWSAPATALLRDHAREAGGGGGLAGRRAGRRSPRMARVGHRAGAKERVQRLGAWLRRRYEGRDWYGIVVEVEGARGTVRASLVGRGQATGLRRLYRRSDA
jgi:hypothetical protein